MLSLGDGISFFYTFDTNLKSSRNMRKSQIIIISFILLLNSLVFSAHIEKNKLNPAFVKALNKTQVERVDGFETGGIAFPVELGFAAFKSQKNVNLPGYYDLRDLGMTAPVETQSSGGCWAYSSMSTVESRLLMTGDGVYDFSDNNLKYCHGFFDSRSTNGNAWMTAAYFARQSGPLLEAQDPYPGGTSQPGVNCPIGEPAAFFIRDARYPPGDMNTIKQLVMDIGSVWSLLYINTSYFNASDNTYFYGGNHAVNHVFNIVGWDDNRVTAGGTGAWICQNTWGAGWGEGGYVYVSYNDTQLLKYNAYYPNKKAYSADSRVLLYDELGNYNSAGYQQETGYALCKYTTTDNIFIEEIGTYAMAYGTSIEMELYSNFDEITGTLSGLLGVMSPHTTEHPGFYTFPIDNQFPLNAGTSFYIKVKYTTPGYDWPIPIEEFIDTYADPAIESDVAWVSENGLVGNWEKIGANTADVMDLCINVYGTYNPVTIPLSNGILLSVFLALIVFYRFKK